MNAQVEPVETFEDAIRDHLVANRQRLVTSAVEQAMTKLSDSLKWNALDHAKKQLDEFFQKEVGPEVAKYLAANREAVIATVIGMVKQTIDDGLKAYAEEIAKDMTDEYKRNRRIAKLFGIETRY